MNSFPHPTPTPASISRRQFLAAAASSAAVGLAATRVSGGESPEAGAISNIDPGFVGPQFFDEQERQALLEVLESGSPFRYWGPGRPVKVQRFEEAFARSMGARFALGVTSGTAALDCAVAGLGIGPGDEVIVPAYTWWSDYTCVVQAGALPVFAEIDRTLNLDPEDFARKITPRTKAVIAVHLLGGPCDLEPILEVARARGVAVIEDAAQCVGGAYRGQKLGALGTVGIYSFQINKMMTSGEGGALVTSDPRGLRARRPVPRHGHDPTGFPGSFRSQPGGDVRGRELPDERIHRRGAGGAIDETRHDGRPDARERGSRLCRDRGGGRHPVAAAAGSAGRHRLRRLLRGAGSVDARPLDRGVA